MGYLSIEDKITIFKKLAPSKIVNLGLITSVPAFLQLNIIKKIFGKKKKTK